MTTHDPDLMQLADQVFTLEDGILRAVTGKGEAS